MQQVQSILACILASSCTVASVREPTSAITVAGGTPTLVQPVSGATPVATSTDTRIPFQSSWRVVAITASDPTSTLRIVARFESAIRLSVPVSVSVRVPAGVRVIRGETQYAIQGLGAGAADERELVLEYGTVPSDDMILISDVHGEGFGSHGETPYRFGREAQTSPLAPRGQPTSINGVNMGAPIQMGQ